MAERRTVLLVEDDARVRLQLAHCLRADGYAVIEAVTADSALQIIEEAECRIDCVFSDIQMPGMLNGIDLARWIMSNRPSLAIILASGGLRTEQVAAAAGAVIPFLAKPFRYERVRKLIAGVFEEQQAA